MACVHVPNPAGEKSVFCLVRQELQSMCPHFPSQLVSPGAWAAGIIETEDNTKIFYVRMKKCNHEIML